MYSERIIQEYVQDSARREGWEPIFHSVDECDDFQEYIEKITDVRKTKTTQYFYWKDDKPPSAERCKWIQRWVENEQVCCFASAKYFITRYAKIRNAAEQIVHFEYRLGQKIFHEVIAECEDKKIAIQLFTLKARQVGLSTVVAMYFIHRILFRPNTYAVMASVQIPQSEKLANMIETAWSRLPFWLVPPKVSIKAKEPRWSNGSLLSVQAGGQEVGIAQGTSPSAVHISEIGDYDNPKRVLEEGLFPACHQLSSLFMVLEGTGSMATTWQKEKWDYYTKNKDKGGRFTPLFIPPSCASDLYPPEDWIRAHPIPDGWSPIDRTRRMRRRGELFVRSTDYLWKYLGQHWEMPKEFQWYWECLYSEAVASHSERQFLSQYAVTPEDAFQSKDDPVFAQETIDLVTSNREKSYAAYAVTGKTILIGNDNKPYFPNPEDVDNRESEIVLDWEGIDGVDYRWNLVPMKRFDDSSDAACFDKLMVYEPPAVGATYAISIDTAHGLNTPNEDRSALSVNRYGGNTEPDVQVASFTSLRVSSPQMSRIAAAVAVLYGTDGNRNVTSSNPLLVKFIIEQVRKPGDECQHQLKIMGLLDHHIMHRYDSKGNIDPSKGTQEGWFTRTYTRSILLDRFVGAVSTGWLILNDPIVIRQLATFMRKYQDHGLSRMEHTSGGHDDNIFACALGWTALHDMENTASRLQSRWSFQKKEKEPNDSWAELSMSLPEY